MRNFMKKSSLALLMTVLVLLTAILVGGMITASAEDTETVEPEATLYKQDGTTVAKSGTFSEVIAAIHGGSETWNYKLVLHTDVELTSSFVVKCIAEFDGQGHTVYLDEKLNGTSAANFFNVTHDGTTVFKNIHFVGQDKDWVVGDWATAKQFGTANGQNAAAMYIPADARVEMIDCTMQYFFSAARASAIVVAQNAGTTYDENSGLYLTNTKIQNNLTTGTTNSSAVYVTPGFAADGRYGNLLHVSGDTVVENNYRVTKNGDDVVVASAFANVYVQQSTVANYQATSTILVHPDFTGSVGIIRGGGGVGNGSKRGVVFFLEDTAGTRTGRIYESSSSGPKTIQPVGTTVVPFETTEGVTCTFNGLWADLSSVLPNITATFVLKDSTGAETLASYEASIAQGAALPTWTAWSDGVIDTTVATFGRTTYTVILPATTEAIANNATTGAWSAGTLADFVATGACTEIEVLKDIELAATITFPSKCNMTIDFGGHTVTKSDTTAKFYLSSNAKVTIKNAIFDGESDPVLVKDSAEAKAAIKDATYYMIQTNTADLTLDNCTFTNCTGGSIYLAATKLVLDDVAIVGGGEGVTAVEAKANSSIYVAGDTQIVITDGNSNNRINAYNEGASIGLAGTFTGQVVFDQWGYAVNRATFYMCDRSYPEDSGKSNYNPNFYRHDYCTVAEGAQLLGKIYSMNQSGWVAYTNQGTLMWTKAGQALPTNNIPAPYVDPEDDSKLYEYGWYYNTGAEGAEDVATTTVQTNIYNYFVKAAQVNADAYILRDGEVALYGTLTNIFANASSGDTVEVMRNLVIPTAGIAMNPAAFTVDFNNFTVTRESKTSYISVNGAPSITWKNGNFDGTIAEAVPTDGRVFLDFANADVTLDSCTFANFRTDGGTEGGSDGNANRGSVVRMRYTGDLLLKDVTMTNCGALYGAVYCFNTIAQQPHVYIEGNTTITCTAGGTNRIHLGTQGGSTLNVSGDFTGTVDVQHSNNKAANSPVTTKNSGQTNEIATPTVAEGAKITGHIYQSDTHTYFAYNNQGVLCWTTEGAALPTLDAKVNATDSNKIDVTVWYYNNGGVETQTDVAIANVANYTVKTVTIEVEAYIVRDGVVAVYGDFADVITKVAANDTVEIGKDITGIKNLVIGTAITIDGNGHTMTWYTTATPDELPTTTVGTGNTNYMIKNTSALIIKNLVLDGGAESVGVWPEGEGAKRNLDNSVMFPHAAALTFDGCTIKGARIAYTLEGATVNVSGSMFGYAASKLTIKDTTIIDNIFKAPSNVTTWNGGLRAFRHANQNAITTYEGVVVFKDNYSLVTKGGATYAYPENAYTCNGNYRSVLGNLAEGSELHFYSGHTIFAALLDENGMLYDLAGKVFIDHGNYAIEADANGKYTSTDYGTAVEYFTYDGVYDIIAASTDVGDYYQVSILAADKVAITTPVDTQGGITSDKFTLSYMPEIKADLYNVEVVVKIGDTEIIRKAFGEFANAMAKKITIDGVDVGMAELTKDIVIELQNKKTKEVLDSYTTSAKTYANALIADTTGTVSEVQKKAVAALLQYGAKVQTYFGYNTDKLAMTADEKTAWVNAGLIVDVDSNQIDTTNATVGATKGGSADGVTISGATLTMENQMSLRLYFTLAEGKTLDDYTFSHEVVHAGGNTYYMEASHIGTGKLATAVTFTIDDGTNEALTYSASPMSYVLVVTKAAESGQITAALKDACEALYYYYAAVANCFDSVTDNTGFEAVASTMALAADGANNYSTPYGINA